MKRQELEQLIKSEVQEYDFRDVEVKVSGDSKCLEIEISQMYEYVEVNFETLQKIAEAIGTQKINVGERDFTSGCESCDWGSNYRVTFYCHDPSVKLTD